MKWNKAKFLYPSGTVTKTFVWDAPERIKNCFCKQGLIDLYYDGIGLGGYYIYLPSKEIQLQADIESTLDGVFDNLFGYSWRDVCKQYPNKESKR
jgi:hypothetical protein